MELYATTIGAKVHWGLSIRTFPASATQRSFTVPPPTTIAGALAYAHASTSNLNREYSDVEAPYTTYTAEFIREYGVRHVAVHVAEPLGGPTLQTIRYFTMPVQAPKTDVEAFSTSLKVAEMFAPIQVGYMACPLVTLTLVVLSDRPIPKRAAWSVLRLGSRESIVTVTSVAQVKASIERLAEGTTLHQVNTSYLAELATPEGSYIAEDMPSPISLDEWLQWYSFKVHPPSIERRMIIPVPWVYVSAKTLKACYGCFIEHEGRRLATLIPVEALER